MISKSFKIKKRDLEKKPITIFQHKLRSFLKCYTITELLLDEINFIVKFKKNYKINGVRMEDKKQHVIKYEIIEIPNDSIYVMLKLTL